MTSFPHNENIKSLIESAKKNIRESDQLSPVFFLGIEDGIGVFMPDFTDDASKSKAADDIRQLVDTTGADWVLFIAESWAAGCKDEKEWARMRADFGPSVSTWPTAKEVVLFRLETPAGCWGGTADILAGRELGTIEWQHNQEERGRFTGFFAKKETAH